MSAPGRSGKTKRYRRSSRASSLRPAHHVAHVLLGQLVVREVERGETVALEVARQLVGLAMARDRDADEDVRHPLVEMR
jgi:hypothetical protein